MDKKNIPLHLQGEFRNHFLKYLIELRGLDANELSLFEWFEREHKQLIEKMLQGGREDIQKQVDAGVEDVNDSGMVAVNYFVRRSR